MGSTPLLPPLKHDLLSIFSDLLQQSMGLVYIIDYKSHMFDMNKSYYRSFGTFSSYAGFSILQFVVFCLV